MSDRLQKDRRVVHSVTTNGPTSDNEWQRVAASDNKWYNERQWVVQWVTTRDNEWQRVTTNGLLGYFFFFFFRIREEPITKHPKEKSLNLEEDLDKGLLNFEQKQAPEKKY